MTTISGTYPAPPTFASEHYRRRLPHPGEMYYWYPDFRHLERFGEIVGADRVEALLSGATPRPTALYVHIPFCRRRCLFCVCDSHVGSRAAIREHIDAVLRELDLLHELRERSGWQPTFDTIHLGGGTPPIVSDDDLQRLVSRLVAFTGGVREIAMEIDPRTVSPDRQEALSSLGVNRVSLGVQDFDAEVLEAVGRPQSTTLVSHFMTAEARRRFPLGVFFDLIAGLPKQTETSFRESAETAVRLGPDRIAISPLTQQPPGDPRYWAIDDFDVPPVEERVALETLGTEVLEAAGYVRTGFDHFAKPGDLLTHALREHTLRRNSIGMSHGRYLDMIGVGGATFSSIGPDVLVGSPYVHWIADLKAGRLPKMTHYRRNPDELIRAEVLNEITSYMALDYQRIAEMFSIDFQKYFAAERRALAPFERDGLIERDSAGFTMTPHGRSFVLPVADLFAQSTLHA